MLRTALYYHQEHPEITFYREVHLSNIENLLRRVVSIMDPEWEQPAEVRPFTDRYLGDLTACIIAENEDYEKKKTKQDTERRY